MPPHNMPALTDTHSGFSLARFSLRQAVLMNLLFVVLILIGGLVVHVMPVDVYPDVDLDEATIDTFWPGASAEDVERLITGRIETEIADIRGVSRTLSDSKPDLSLIRVKFHEHLSPTELDAAFRQLRAAVDRVTGLPSDARKPLITRISLAEIFPLLWVVTEDTGGAGEDMLHEIVLRLKPILREIPGVAKVDDKLIRDRELRILVDHDRLREFDLTLDEVATVLRQYNRNVPSGTLPHDRGEYSVRAVGEAMNPEQLGGIAVKKHANGSHVYLRDIARIERDFARKTFFARLNANDCKALAIAKTDAADSRVVSNLVREVVAKFSGNLPPGTHVSVCLDASNIIRSRVRILMTNLVSGIGLVFISLWVVMGLRNSILAIIGIPFSFLCALIFMHLIGVTINAVSLFAMVLCSGMIVDDAIVVLENIYRHIEMGKAKERSGGGEQPLWTAIVDGTNEVMWPVISSSATTVVAFLPMLFMGGIMGKFFSIIPKTVAVVLLASLFECLLMIPVHYLTFGPRTRVRSAWSRLSGKAGLEGGPSRSVVGWLMAAYDRLLVGILRHRYLAPLPLLALGYATYCFASWLRVDLFPSDYQLVVVDLKAWDDASLDQTGRVVKPIEQIVLSMGPEYVESMLTAVGLIATDDNAALWRNNLAQLQIQLGGGDDVAADPDVVTNRLRQEIGRYVEQHPEAGIRSFKVWAPQDGPPIGKPVAIRIECADLSLAKRLAGQFKQRLAEFEGTFGVVDNLDFGLKQINLRLKEDIASAHGLLQPSLSSALRTANDGVVVSTFKDTRSGEDQDVRMMLDAKYRRKLTDLLDIEIRSPHGYLVRLGRICDLDMSQGYASIPHVNGKRVVTVTAEVDTQKTSATRVNAAIEDAFEPILAGFPNVRVTYGGEYHETVASFGSLQRAYLIALVVIYMLLATQFRSYIQPLVIIVTVPFSCVGVVGGLLLNDYPFTIMTFIAMVGLTGVVVNDSIVLLDFVNRQLATGKGVAEALRTACALRVRPVLLTTLTTVLGLLPLAMGWGGTSKIWSPFASSFAWGLTLSTVLTLVIVPAIYHIGHDLVTFVQRRKGSHARDTEPASAISHAR